VGVEALIIENLSAMMRAAGATNISLAEASGVCPRTICNARAGQHISRLNNFCITEALRTRTFTRDPRGAR